MSLFRRYPCYHFQLEDGCQTFEASNHDGAACTRTYTIAYELRVVSKCTRNNSCAKLQVPYCVVANAKGTISNGRVIPVRTLVQNDGSNDSDSDNMFKM